MPAKRKSALTAWESEAITELLRNRTRRESFKINRIAEDMFIGLSEYAREPNNCTSSKQLLHAKLVYFHWSGPEYEYKIVKGDIGGASEMFINYALTVVPEHTRLRSTLLSAVNRWQREGGDGAIRAS